MLFRIYPIAITADIEKAFLQIQVDTDHRDLRFLYCRNIDDPNAETVGYRFTGVIFGATCSQCLVNDTVQKQLVIGLQELSSVQHVLNV